MFKDKSKLGPALLWGGLTAALYWLLFQYAGSFEMLAHTTLDACVVGADYYSKATTALCAAENGTLIEGRWWYVLAPIGLAFALSYTHGLFTGLFWDLIGLKAK